MTDQPFDDSFDDKDDEQDDAQELPWGEAQWERFMQRSETRAARFGELLETLIDHPDRDEIIDREMGWDCDDGPGEGWKEGEPDEWDEEADELEAMKAAMEEPPSEEALAEAEAEIKAEKEALKRMPAYKAAHAWGLRVHFALKDHFDALGDELGELAGDALGNGHIVAAKLAGGHAMGYDDDTLCGQIVCVKRALDAAAESVRNLRELTERYPPLRDTLAPLITEGDEVHRLVEQRIAELRAKVWWE